MSIKRKLTSADRNIADHLAGQKLVAMRNQSQELSDQRHRFYMNACAEVAVCHYLKIRYMSAKIQGNPLGIMARNKRLRVVYSSKDSGDLVVTVDTAMESDAVVLCQGTDHTIEIIGWLPSPELDEYGFRQKYGNNDVVIIKDGKLLPMARIAKFIQDDG